MILITATRKEGREFLEAPMYHDIMVNVIDPISMNQNQCVRHDCRWRVKGNCRRHDLGPQRNRQRQSRMGCFRDRKATLMVRNVWYLASGIQYAVYSIWYMVCSTWYVNLKVPQYMIFGMPLALGLGIKV